MKKDEKLVLWTERLQAFQASGQTCREWCRLLDPDGKAGQRLLSLAGHTG